LKPNTKNRARVATLLFALGGLAIAATTPFGPFQGRKTTDPPGASRGKMGQDLFLAIDHRDLSGMQALLKKGADTNSRNGLDFTPLYIAAASHQFDAMKALVEAGADVDARSPYGSPLTFAAITGNAEGAELLLAKGADVNVSRGDGTSPLMMAAFAGNPAAVGTLLKYKAEVNTKNDAGSSALIFAARAGNVQVVQQLVGAGAKIDEPDADGLTPLMIAARAGQTNFVKLMLKLGANAKAVDKDKSNALILATSFGDYPEIVKSLVAAGCDPNATDGRGRSAAALAYVRGFKQSASLLGKPSSAAVSAVGVVRSTKEAAGFSLKAVQESMAVFMEDAACLSCHHEGLGRMATASAKSRGFKLDPAVTNMQNGRLMGAANAMHPLFAQALKSPEAMKQLPLIEINEISPFAVWMFGGMCAQDNPKSPPAESLAEVLARQQSADGHWSFSLPRIPMQSSAFTLTALAVQGIQKYAPTALNKSRIAKAQQWLAKTPAMSSDDMAFKLLGLRWSGAAKSDIAKTMQTILAKQNPDGGWSQMSGMASDAYATGQSLYALAKGGSFPVTSAAYKKGVDYLLRTQDKNGTWFVNKRAIAANNYFDTGFPYGESQFSSFNGTCWAMMALLETLPKR
jgi:ankyrin repeat protein